MRLFKIDPKVMRKYRIFNVALQMAYIEAIRMYFLHEISVPFNQKSRNWRINLIREMLPCAEAHLIANPYRVEK